MVENPTIMWEQTSGMDLYLALKDQEETVRVFVENSMRCSVWVLITSVFWFGADGLPGVEDKIEPVLQSRPGVYNDSILAGLDYLLTEMSKRKMVAVLYLTNSWEWSGGYGA